MNTQKKFGAFTSSTNSQEVSLTITSIVKIIGLVLGGIAAMKGSSAAIDDAQMEILSQALTTLIVSGFAIKESANVVYGIFRKILAKFYE